MVGQEDTDYEQALEEWADRMVKEGPEGAIDAMTEGSAWLSFVDQRLFEKTGIRATPRQLDAMSRTRSGLLRRILRGFFRLDT